MVVFAQNHDQVGNRAAGDRLDRLAGLEGLKLAGAAVLLSPFIPLLFMGQEYGERAPFPFFVSHSEPGLVEAVRQGRARELAGFGWTDEPPDPQAEETFISARLGWETARTEPHRSLFRFHQELIRLRKTFPSLAAGGREAALTAETEGRVLTLRRKAGEDQALILLNLSPEPARVGLESGQGRWTKLIDSAMEIWGGPGSPLPDRLDCPGSYALTMAGFSAAVYKPEKDR
jgi:maltooligosyltrehalose trehalohydrolase